MPADFVSLLELTCLLIFQGRKKKSCSSRLKDLGYAQCFKKAFSVKNPITHNL